MALTIKTNVGTLVPKKDLEIATKALKKAIGQVSVYKLKLSDDNNVDYAAASKMNTKLNSISIAQDNVSIASNLLSTTKNGYNQINNQLLKINDMIQQVEAGVNIDIKSEVEACLNEINKIADNTEFNGIKLIDGEGTPSKSGLVLQIGLDKSANSRLVLDKSIFSDAHSKMLFDNIDKDEFFDLVQNFDSEKMSEIVKMALDNISEKSAKIDSIQAKLDGAADILEIQYANVSSSLSTIRDANIVSESSELLKNKILEQASLSLTSVANQSPSIALNLI